VSADSIQDPYRLDMTCTVTRGATTIFEGAVNTAKLHRKLETLVEFLTRANPVPAGTVLLTGTGIIVPQSCALAVGDIVRIAIAEIGELANPVTVVG
jgi:2-dehydro-3-deoxy-D-arabinonate dehydratase